MRMHEDPIVSQYPNSAIEIQW